MENPSEQHVEEKRQSVEEKRQSVEEKPQEKRVLYVATECENTEQAQKAWEYINENIGGTDLHVLSCIPLDSPEVCTLSQYMIRKYRLHHPTRRHMILSSEEQLLTTQLCLAEVNKQKYGEFHVEASQVLEYNTKLVLDKLSGGDQESSDKSDEYTEFREAYKAWLKHSNVIDLADVLCGLEDEYLHNENVLIIGHPVGKVEEHLACRLVASRRVVRLHFDTQGEVSTEEEAWTPRGDTAPNSKGSVTETYVEKVVMSYLHLLVNSRSELALARVINVPHLDHEAFTRVKHYAKGRNMPMYQTILSYVMRLRLGGKSYQVGEDCPMTLHTKSLAELTDLMHKMQTVLEEEEEKNNKNTRVAAKRVLIALKNALLKATTGLRRDSVLAVIERTVTLVDTITITPALQDKKAGGSMVGHLTLHVLRLVVDEYCGKHCSTQNMHILTDNMSSQNTPMRFPSVMSQFRSPLDQPDSPDTQPLQQRIKLSAQSANTPVAPKRYKSTMDWARPLHDVGLSNSPTLIQTPPSKPVVLLRPPTPDPEPVAPAPAAPSAKRTLSNSLSSRPAKKPKNSVNPSKPASKTKKVTALGKGQKQLTSFFRV